MGILTKLAIAAAAFTAMSLYLTQPAPVEALLRPDPVQVTPLH